SFADFDEMSQGTGTIRVQASAKLAPITYGVHRLYYRNTHQSEMGAYLVNVLMPEDKGIQVERQNRDYEQHELTVEYKVTTFSVWTSLWWLAGGVATISVLAIARRRSLRWRLLTYAQLLL